MIHLCHYPLQVNWFPYCSRTIAFYFRLVASHEQEIASSMLAAFLGIGIACGSLINLPLIQAL